MPAENLYAIRYVAQRTGLTTHVIRAWEKRYQAVVPHRSSTNRRLYSDSDINRYQLLKKVTDAGHSISQVAKLSTDDLSDLARREALIVPTTLENTHLSPASTDHDHYDACLAAVLRLDPDSFENELGQAAINLSRLSLLNKIICPLFEEIGNLWQNGSLKIINEHMASSVTRTFLLNMLRSTEIDNTAPKIVVATLSGQWHELGALSVALAAAESGWKAIYYGPNLPAEEIAAGAKHIDARAVAIRAARAHVCLARGADRAQADNRALEDRILRLPAALEGPVRGCDQAEGLE